MLSKLWCQAVVNYECLSTHTNPFCELLTFMEGDGAYDNYAPQVASMEGDGDDKDDDDDDGDYAPAA